MQKFAKVMKIVAKLTLNVFLGFVFYYVSLFLAFIIAFSINDSAKGRFYLNMVIAAGIILFIFATAQIWGLIKPKIRYIIFAGIVVAMLLSVAGFEIYKVHDNNIMVMSEQGVDLGEYEPFSDNTKAVSLDQESTLKLSDNLPTIDGATAFYPLYSAFVKAVYSKEEYDENFNLVKCTKTANAYQNLINGDVDIIFALQPSEQQLEEAKNAGVKLKLTPIGREAFVFFANPKNPVSNLSIQDVQKIYSGKATNWNEFGGKNTRIKAFQRPENSGSQTAIIKFMEDIPRFCVQKL